MLLTVIGAMGWVISVVLAVVTLGATKVLTYVFGIFFIFSLPTSVFWELVLKLKKERRAKDKT